MFGESVKLLTIPKEDEVEKELLKWRRRWALEEIKERTVDFTNPNQPYFQKLHDKLVPVHTIIDPDIKDYLIEKEGKSNQPEKTSNEVALAQTIKLRPSPQKRNQFCMEKLFERHKELENGKIINSRAIVTNNSSIFPNIEGFHENFPKIKERGDKLSLKEHFNRILVSTNDESSEAEMKTFLKPEIMDFSSFMPKAQLPSEIYKMLDEVDDIIKEGDKIVDQIAKHSANRKAEMEKMQEEMKQKGFNFNFNFNK